MNREKVFNTEAIINTIAQNKPVIAFGATVLLIALLMWSTSLQKVVTPDIEGEVLGIETSIEEEEQPAEVVLPTFHYIEIVNGCGPYYTTGVCVNMRSGPSTKYKAVARLRTGVVLKVEKEIVKGEDEHDWYKVILDKDIRHPERVTGNWYIAVDSSSIRPFENIGDENTTKETGTTIKRIVVDKSSMMLSAYDGDILFMQAPVSIGLDGTPTPAGTFSAYKKTPSRYMQGPIEGGSDDFYDLPGVPWNLYFTQGGAVIHGAYWHDHFGEPWSHGCVNLSLENAKKLYLWADIGTKVQVL